MSKRNLIILIVLIIVVAFAFGVLYFYKPASKLGSETTGTNFLSEFFPFGKSTTVDTGEVTPPADISGYIPPTTGEIPKEILTKISSMPIAGYTVFQKERFKEETKTTPEEQTPATDNTTPAVEKKPIPLVAPTTEFAPALRYVERATGNIYQTFVDKIGERKFTTTIIPAVYEAYFGDNANSVVFRYLKQDEKTIETFAGTIPKEILGGDTSSLNEVKGSFLPDNITDMSTSPDGSSVFYLFNIENGSVGVTASIYGDKKNQIFNSPFTEWLTMWPNDRMITLTTKPSFNVLGYMYSLDPSVKKMNKIISGIKGLTTLTSPSGKLVLYNNNNLSLKIFNTSTQDSVSIGIKTMPEKCTWNSTSTNLYCAIPKYINGTEFPDIWYRGETSFSDEIWKINTETGSASKIADPASFSGGEEIDGIKLSLDENENYLFFVNKKDSYLWELNLK